MFFIIEFMLRGNCSHQHLMIFLRFLIGAVTVLLNLGFIYYGQQSFSRVPPPPPWDSQRLDHESLSNAHCRRRRRDEVDRNTISRH